MYTTRHHTKILTRKLIPNQTTNILHHTNQHTGWQTITKPDSSLPHQLHYLHHRQHTHPINHNPKKKSSPPPSYKYPPKISIQSHNNITPCLQPPQLQPTAIKIQVGPKNPYNLHQGQKWPANFSVVGPTAGHCSSRHLL